MSLKDDLIIWEAHRRAGTLEAFVEGENVPLSQDDKEAAEDAWNAERAKGVTGLWRDV